MASVGVLPLIGLLLGAGIVSAVMTLVLFLAVAQQQSEAAEAFLGAREARAPETLPDLPKHSEHAPPAGASLAVRAPAREPQRHSVLGVIQ